MPEKEANQSRREFINGGVRGALLMGLG
ncbi:MAG: hypothetical protein ACD_62C00056G0001, partial [uncultured bacterium]